MDTLESKESKDNLLNVPRATGELKVTRDGEEVSYPARSSDGSGSRASLAFGTGDGTPVLDGIVIAVDRNNLGNEITIPTPEGYTLITLFHDAKAYQVQSGTMIVYNDDELGYHYYGQFSVTLAPGAPFSQLENATYSIKPFLTD